MPLRGRLPYVAGATAVATVLAVAVGVGVTRGSAPVAADPPHTPTVEAPGAGETPSSGAPRPSPTSARPTVSAARSTPAASPTAHRTSPSTRPPSAKPKPAPFRFPVPVVVGTARQVVTVDARGSYATVLAWQWRGGAWHEVLATTSARVGPNGVVPGATRRQGSGTTPGGTYTMTQAFGIAADPGAKLPYHQVTSDDWWVEDNLSAYYNQMRRASQGGFRTNLPSSDINSSEHLDQYTVEYQYAVVIDFNRWPAVRYRGAGIFLHVNGDGATAGCVSVPQSVMVRILRWLDPAQHPRIAIA